MSKYDLTELDEYTLGSPFWSGINNRAWVEHCPEAEAKFFEDLMATDPGKKYAAFRTDATDEQLFGYHRFSKFYGNEISVRSMAQALHDMLISQSFVLPQVVEVVDTRPRDKNGKFLTDAQVKWGEMTRFLSEHSMQEVNQRRRTDPAFTQFCIHNLRTEMQSTPIGDVPGAPPERTKPAGAALREFARLLALEPQANLRPINGKVTLNGETINNDKFLELVSACRNAHLL